MKRPGVAGAAFALLCAACEIVLLVWDRQTAYLAFGAFAYGLLLWLMTRAFVPLDAASEETFLVTRARGAKLALRVAIVALAFGYVVAGRGWFWSSPLNAAIQHIGSSFGLGNGSSALPNFLFEAFVPGTLLLLLGATPAELGLTMWRRRGSYALLGALALPAVFAGLWFARGSGSAAMLALYLVHNLLSNGFSEEFLMRGMTLSHLRAFVSKEWAVAVQAVLFGLFHVNVFSPPDNWVVELARNIAANAPMGFFLALIALRVRSVVLPGLIHTTLDTMMNFMR